MKFAILTPSRQRPKELYRFFDSVNSTMSNNNMIFFFVGIDNDDPSLKDYYDVIHRMQSEKKSMMIVTVIEDIRKTTARIWNDLVRLKSWPDSPDYFIMGNDDLVYKTNDWDQILAENIDHSDHPFYLYWFDDGINGEKHCAFPIVSKYWVGATGYFVPEMFHYFYSDTWTFDIAVRAGVCKYIPSVLTQHLHFSLGKHIPYDETYSHNRKGNNNAEDAKTFEETIQMRVKIAESIKLRIHTWTSDGSKSMKVSAE
jgi:hypothetical protein